MKFKKKLISLSIVVAAFCGFYSSKNSVEAVKKVNRGTQTYRKCIKNKKANKRNDSDSGQNFKNSENKQTDDKYKYSKNNFLQSKPNFIIDVDLNESNPNYNDMSLYFSPTQIKKLFPAEAKVNFENLCVEIVDDMNHVYKNMCKRYFTDIKKQNLIRVFFENIDLVKRYKNSFSHYGIEVDEGFKIDANQIYKVRLINLDDNFKIEKSCISTQADT